MGRFIRLTAYIITFALSTTLSLAEQVSYIPTFPGVEVIKEAAEISTCAGPFLYTDQLAGGYTTTNITQVRRLSPTSGGGLTHLQQFATKENVQYYSQASSINSHNSATRLDRQNHPSDYYIYTLRRIRI